MKKIYLSLFAVAAFTVASAQTNGEATTTNIRVGNSKTSLHTQASKTSSVFVQDELWYYQNKHDLRNPNNYGYPGVYSQPAASYTQTNFVSKVGSVYENPGTVVISGMAGLALSYSTSPSPSVDVAFFLYNASGTPLVPTGAPLATFTTQVSGSTFFSFIGGTITPIPVTGPYALIMQCASTNTLDKIAIATTNAKTQTATAAPVNERFGEGMGIVGTVAGNWFVSTGVFGAEDDREGIVTPVVAYSFSVGASPSTHSTCNTSTVTFINSSTFVGNRQYNVNALVSQWAPFVNTTLLTQYAPDSAFTWNFGDNSTSYKTNPSHSYQYTVNTTANDQLIGKLKTQLTPSVASQFESASWTMTITICNVGLTENSIDTQMGVYPNPATDKITVFLNNATPSTQIQVLNALGQVVLTRTNLTEKNELNTESLSKGVYFVRVSNGKREFNFKINYQ